LTDLTLNIFLKGRPLMFRVSKGWGHIRCQICVLL